MKTAFIKNCNAFIVAGASSFEYLRGFGLPEKNIFIAPNAVDTEFFAEHAAHVRSDSVGQRLRLGLPNHFALYVGRLVKEKGVFDLLHAYAKLAPNKREGLSLVFVGDGAARQELEKQAERISPGRVDFAGFLQRRELVSYYALADMFVLPTHTDPWGLVVNEAMACSLPVICTDAAGCAPNLVKDRWNGMTFPVQDTATLGLAITELSNDAELRCAMGKRSKEWISRNSPDACAAGIAQAVLESKVTAHAE
jgi:glycosyltransferase involved in cell wall biosynthesis